MPWYVCLKIFVKIWRLLTKYSASLSENVEKQVPLLSCEETAPLNGMQCFQVSTYVTLCWSYFIPTNLLNCMFFLKISSLKDESALTDFSFPQAFHPDSVTLEKVCRNQRLLASSLKPQKKQRAQTEKVQSVQNKLKKNPRKVKN